MRKLIVLPILAFTRLLFAGGISGGGPPPLMLEPDMIIMSTIPDLGLEKTPVSPEVYRRAMARLSLDKAETAPISIDGRDLEVKALRGGIVDVDETSQLIMVK